MSSHRNVFEPVLKNISVKIKVKIQKLVSVIITKFLVPGHSNTNWVHYLIFCYKLPTYKILINTKSSSMKSNLIF